MKKRLPQYDNNINIDRRVKINQMQRNVRRSQIGLRRIRALIRLLLILVIVFAGYKVYKLPQWYLDKNVFSSTSHQSLTIVGNKITPTYKILSILRQTPVPQRPIYLYNTRNLEKEIESLEPVKKVYIRRYWFPARLNIIVLERKPILSISPAENVPPIAFFAEGGKLIGREYLPLSKSFKTVLVLSYGVKGDDYRKWDVKKVQSVAALARALEGYSHEKVIYLDFRNPKDVYAKLETVNVRIGELNSTAMNRIKNITSILPEVSTLDKKIKYIDLRWEDTQYIKLEE